jgi:hypothetical protein
MQFSLKVIAIANRDSRGCFKMLNRSRSQLRDQKAYGAKNCDRTVRSARNQRSRWSMRARNAVANAPKHGYDISHTNFCVLDALSVEACCGRIR